MSSFDSEMVERVARAISDNIQAGLPDGVVVDYRYAARAVIAAMRESTDAMTYAGSNQLDCARELQCWQAMIDEALK